MKKLKTSEVEKEKIAPLLMKNMGVGLKKKGNSVRFVFKNNQILDELSQLGFSLDILIVGGGSLPLPLLREHVDNQSALEAYWGSMAEKSRYMLSVAQDNFNHWYELKYAKCFAELQERGVPKPIQREVEARISFRHSGQLLKRRKKIRKLEQNYRILHNVCYMSVLTKGKMMQTLRNIIQGGNNRMPDIGVETPEHPEPSSIRATLG